MRRGGGWGGRQAEERRSHSFPRSPAEMAEVGLDLLLYNVLFCSKLKKVLKFSFYLKNIEMYL